LRRRCHVFDQRGRPARQKFWKPRPHRHRSDQARRRHPSAGCKAARRAGQAAVEDLARGTPSRQSRCREFGRIFLTALRGDARLAARALPRATTPCARFNHPLGADHRLGHLASVSTMCGDQGHRSRHAQNRRLTARRNRHRGTSIPYSRASRRAQRRLPSHRRRRGVFRDHDTRTRALYGAVTSWSSASRPRAVLDADAVRHQGTTRSQYPQRYGFTIQYVIRGADGTFEVRIASPLARRNCCPPSASAIYALCSASTTRPSCVATRTRRDALCLPSSTVGCSEPPLFTIIAGLLLGGVVHLVAVLALARLAPQAPISGG